MADVSNPESAKYRGVAIDHPSIVRHLEGCKKNGISKMQAAKTAGVPMEVVDRVYARGDKK